MSGVGGGGVGLSTVTTCMGWALSPGEMNLLDGTVNGRTGWEKGHIAAGDE